MTEDLLSTLIRCRRNRRPFGGRSRNFGSDAEFLVGRHQLSLELTLGPSPTRVFAVRPHRVALSLRRSVGRIPAGAVLGRPHARRGVEDLILALR